MKSIEILRDQTETTTLSSITVDIFDTVLLRKVWPEGLQFLETAKRTLSVYQEEIDPSITAFEVYSWREYAREELLSAKRQDADQNNDVDINLEEWFSELYSLLQAKYTGKPKKISKKILGTLIAAEIEIEKEYTRPNLDLIEALRDEKAGNPKLKVYFASDMYLTAKQVTELLEHHNIMDVFDGGITSTDEGNAKHSSRLYYHMQAHKDINLKQNLHIGDNHHSDVATAKLAGSGALLYYKPRLRRARTFAGRVQLKLIKMNEFRKESKAFKKSLAASRSIGNTKNRGMYDLGYLFSQPMASYLLHVGTMATKVEDKHYIFVSSEAPTFVEAGKHLFGALYDRPESALKLNRKRAISAVAWTIITRKDVSLVSQLVKTIKYGEIGDNRKELYDFLLTPKYKVDSAKINALSQKAFYKALYEDLQAADKKYTKHLEEAYDYVVSTLPKDEKTVVICDVGWGGTVQAVYTVFAKLHNYRGSVEGLYLGVHSPARFGLGNLPMTGYLLPDVLSRKYRPYWSAVIWEYVYTNKFQFEGDEERLKFVQDGLKAGYDHYRNIHVNPTDYFHKVIAKKIKRLLRHPTNAEVSSIGEIRYDFGFNDPQILRIVDTEYPRLKFWAKLILKPKATLALIVAPNNWTGGYIKRFNLIGIPTVLKVLGRLKKTYYL